MVEWPEASRLVPAASNSIKVEIHDGGSAIASRVLDRPAASATFDPLPVGELTATATAYPVAGASGTPQATGSVPLQIETSQNTAVTLTMASTIDRVEISPSPADAPVALVATARDSNGNTVLVPADKPFEWTIESGAQYVSVGQYTGVVTGLGAGTGTIRATERESGKSGTVAVTVPLPTVTLTAEASSIVIGDSTTLQWASTGADTVVDSNFGAAGVSGSEGVSPISAATYTITVSGPGGQATDSTTVKVSWGVGTPGLTRTNAADSAEAVWIPGGTFTMGDDNSDYSNERPAHQQTVGGFWLYTKEVTNKQYGQFMEATGHAAPAYWNDRQYNALHLPVVGVGWADAQAYSQWAEARLPTEVEWEYAARGGQQLQYATSTGQLNDAWLGRLANYDGKSGVDQYDQTAPGGTFPANPFGVHDMSGNVWEWCSTIYRSYPYTSTDGREDLNASGDRALRGGAFYVSAIGVRCATRGNARSIGDIPYSFGFRCAKSP